MKKLLLSAIVLTVVGITPLALAAGPIDGKIYGKVNISLVNTDSDSGDVWKLNSNASRIGFKGATKVSDGLEVFYKTEFEIAVDDGSFDNKTSGDDTDKVTFKQRNIVAGIKGSFGSVLAGKHDTPTKLAQKKIDLFNDLEGDIKNTFEGENRISNMLAYSSPKMGDFSATVAVMPSEGDNGTGLTDGISYSLSYSKDDLYIALAGDQDVDDQDLLRIVSQYNMDALQLGLMYQENDTTDESGYFASAAYKIDKTTYKAQYGSNKDKTTLSLGADYKLAKNTKTFVFYTDIEHPSKGDSSTFGMGLEHKF